MKRFPFGLTIAVAISLVILITLGTWQLQRLAWKTTLLADIAAAQKGPAVEIDDILQRQAAGQRVEWRRVSLRCLPPPPQARPTLTGEATGKNQVLLYGVTDGEIAWRVLSPCRLAQHPEITVGVERGILLSETGSIEPKAVATPLPESLTGIVRLPEPARRSVSPMALERIAGGYRMPQRSAFALRLVGSREAPANERFYVAVESEAPQPASLRPAPTPPDIPNRHLEYALTWFGLAGALLAIYAAMIWRRFKAQ
jgi:surfeit locus 1 family protein